MGLKKLEEEVKLCKKCELHKNRIKSVFSRGIKKAKIMLIGEAPGKDENKKGKPFVGKSGQLLDELLKEAGFNVKKDIYICNVVKCRPIDENGKDRPPSADEIQTCKKFLDAQIEIIKPKIIVLCGNTAVEAFEIKGNMKDIHGSLCGEKYGAKLFTIHHLTPKTNRWITKEDRLQDLKQIKGHL